MTRGLLRFLTQKKQRHDLSHVVQKKLRFCFTGLIPFQVIFRLRTGPQNFKLYSSDSF